MTTPVPAKANAAFLDSIGVNIHSGYFGYPTADSSQTGPAIAALGARHVRDAAYLNGTTYNDSLYGGMQAIHNASGARFNLIIDPRSAGLSTVDSTKIDAIRAYVGSFTDSYEGINEYDISGDTNWASVVTSYQQALYAAVKANSHTEKVVGPSFVFPQDYTTVGSLASYVDVSNTHNYYSGRNPGGPPWGFYGYAIPQFQINSAHVQSANAPVWVTESGYHNALQASGSQPAIPESVGGDYVARTFLEHFRLGIARTYAYELVDLGADQTYQDYNWGLMRSDFTPKPAYTTLKNMLTVLADSSPNNNPSGLFYAFSGNTTGLHHLLLQSSTGKFYLIVWLERSQYNVTSFTLTSVPAQSVGVTLGKTFSTLKVYEPKTSTTAQSTVNNTSSLSLSVGPTPLIIEMATPSDYTPTFESQTIKISSSGNDGHAYRVDSAAYPPNTTATYSGTDEAIYVERDYYNSKYHVDVVLLRFDTSVIPDNATITRAVLRFYVTNAMTADNLSMSAEWGTRSFSSTDYTNTPGTSALSGVPLSNIVIGTENDVELISPGANIALAGTTDLRLHVTQRANDAAPTGYNFITIRSFDDLNMPEPELRVEYTLSSTSGTDTTRRRMAIRVPKA